MVKIPRHRILIINISGLIKEVQLMDKAMDIKADALEGLPEEMQI